MQLAEPLAAVVSQTAAGQFTAVSASCSVARFSADDLSAANVLELPIASSGGAAGPLVRGAIRLAGGTGAFAPLGAATELRVLLSDADALQRVPLPGELAGSPIAWRDGIALATASGAIHYLDPQTGSPKAEPFQLRLRPGQRLGNCRLSAVGDRGSEIAVSDGGNALYCIGLGSEGAPRLVEFGATQLQSPPIGDLLVGDKNVGLVDVRGNLLIFVLPDVKQVGAFDLAARAIVSGPVHLDASILLATDRDELVCLDGSLALAWKAPLVHGPLAGEPVASPGGLLVSSRGGWLCSLDDKGGKETGAVDLGQPLAGTPVVGGSYALVPAADGSLLKVSLPLAKAAQP
jgi:hypothetical protein